MTSQSDNTSKDQPVDELRARKLLEAVAVAGGLSPMDFFGIMVDAKQLAPHLDNLIQAECNRARLNELDYVDPTATVTVATGGIVSEMTVQERKAELQQLMKESES